MAGLIVELLRGNCDDDRWNGIAQVLRSGIEEFFGWRIGFSLLYDCGQRDGDDYMRLIPKYSSVDEW